jgi:hypothetical protein
MILTAVWATLAALSTAIPRPGFAGVDTGAVVDGACAYEGGYGSLCPYFYSRNGEKYEAETTFLVDIDSVVKKTTTYSRLNHFDIFASPRALIREIEPESSKIDMLKIKVTLKSGWGIYLDPVWASRGYEELMSVDDMPLVLKQGDDIYLEFESLTGIYYGQVDKVELVANGYYDVYEGYRHDPETGKIIKD